MKNLFNETARIRCPKSGKVIKIPISYSFVEDKKVYLPCGGCNNCDGSDICGKCMAYVTVFLFENPEHRLSTPIEV